MVSELVPWRRMWWHRPPLSFLLLTLVNTADLLPRYQPLLLLKNLFHWHYTVSISSNLMGLQLRIQECTKAFAEQLSALMNCVKLIGFK